MTTGAQATSDGWHAGGETPVVGMLGLGDMGSGMARNLVRAGYQVVAADPGPQAPVSAARAGARLVGDARAVGAAATAGIVAVVRTEEQTRSSLIGADGVVATARPGVPVLVASTLMPSAMADLADELSSAGLYPISAALSGGPWGADAGTLTFMVSGPAEATTAAQPLFDAMGSHTYVVSERVEAAQAAKLGVQLIYGVTMFGLFEALRLGAAFGLGQRDLMDVYTHSVADSWVARNWDHVREWWEGGGNGLDILVKDVRATMREADRLELSLPVTSLSFDLMRTVWDAFGHTMPAAADDVSDPIAWT